MQRSLTLRPTSALSRGGYSERFQQAQDMSAFPPAAHDLLFLDDLLSPEEKGTRYAVRGFMVGRFRLASPGMRVIEDVGEGWPPHENCARERGGCRCALLVSDTLRHPSLSSNMFLYVF